jgi:sugar lactone lactonase YvrE
LGVALDSGGMIYIADTYNNRIRKVSPSGIIQRLRETAPTKLLRLCRRWRNRYQRATQGVAGLTVDTEGNLFVADSSTTACAISPWILTTVAGVGGSQGYSGDGGPAAKAQIGAPSALALDRAGNLYVATTGNYRVRKVSPSGIITTVAGNGSYGFSGDGGPATSAQLGNASGLAVDSAGNLYIAQDFRVRQISPDGIITTLPQTGVIARGLAIDSSGNLYLPVTDGRHGLPPAS